MGVVGSAQTPSSGSVHPPSQLLGTGTNLSHWGLPSLGSVPSQRTIKAHDRLMEGCKGLAPSLHVGQN